MAIEVQLYYYVHNYCFVTKHLLKIKHYYLKLSNIQLAALHAKYFMTMTLVRHRIIVCTLHISKATDSF